MNDDERHALVGRAAPRPVGRRASSTSPTALVVALISLAVIGFLWYVQDVGGLRAILDPQARPAATSQQAPAPTIAPGTTLKIVWQSDDLAPAAHAGQVCVTADGPGQICASYVAGERPADSLTRAVRRRGYRVQSGTSR